MEPQHVYKQRLSTEREDTSSFAARSYEREKIQSRKYKGIFILNIILQTIIAFLSIIFFLLTPTGNHYIVLLFITMLLLNIFFSILIWVSPKKLKNIRKVLYSCFAFISTLVLLYVSSIAITEANSTGALLLAWAIAILLDTVVYWFARLIPPVVV